MSLAQALEHALEGQPSSWWVAYSGGRDSSVLLHAACDLARRRGARVQAVHVHHGLHRAADDFVRHCEETCAGLGVRLSVRRVDVGAGPGDSIEERARIARYRSLRELATGSCVVLLAHHRKDQAETVLLQLLRGSGVAGTAAMPPARALGEGVLLRPWLDCDPCDIEAYAALHGIGHIEDPGNAEPNLARNALRGRLWPILEDLWPAAQETLARAARHHAQANRLLRERAREDGADREVLPVERLRELSADRRANLLRFWLEARGVARPAERRLRAWWQAVDGAAADRQPVLRVDTGQVVRWHDALYFVEDPTVPDTPPRGCYPWPEGQALYLPPLGQTLQWDELCAQWHGLPGDDLEVRFRQGGERCRLPGHVHRRPLKKLLQESAVPPWRRGRIPLIYERGCLRLVWGHFSCAPSEELAAGPAASCG